MSDVKSSIPRKNSNFVNKIMSADLREWNKYLSLLYIVQGIVILILSANRSFPVTTSFLGVDTLQTQAQGSVVLATGTQHLFDVNMAYLVAVFLFLAAIAHGALVVTRLRSTYEHDIKKGINKFRWLEYALSGGTMMVVIGLLVGVQDVSTLVMLFGATVVMNLLGLVMEVHNQGARTVNWLSYMVGCVAGILAWIVVAIYLVSGAVYGAAAHGFVYWVAGTMFVLFSAFAVNAYLQYRKVGEWKDYVYGERMYMVLSLVAKTALAWQVFAGLLHP